IATRQNNEGFSVNGLAWSPDGAIVVCPATSWTNSGYKLDLIGVDVKTRTQQSIGTKSWFAILQVAWQADMSHLIISAREKPTGPYRLWRITYPNGVVERLTHDPAEYRGVSLADNKILTVRSERNWEMSVANASDNYQARPAIVSGAGLVYGLTWAGNDKIVYSSMTGDLLN